MAKFEGGRRADTIRGTERADSFEGKGGNDRLFGLGGNDDIEGDAGNDFLDGGEGNDILEGGLGNDTLTGGAGSDIFQFKNARTGTDTITDFTDGVDRIEFDLARVNAFRDLTISTNADGDAVVSWNGGSITLEGVDAASLDASDFLF